MDGSDEEVIFFCKTCFENNPPPASDKNVIGCFTLDLKTFSLQKSLKPEQQIRALRSVKYNIKKHMLENQIHEHKVEEKLKREKGEPDKDSRSKKVGLDLF